MDKPEFPSSNVTEARISLADMVDKGEITLDQYRMCCAVIDKNFVLLRLMIDNA